MPRRTAGATTFSGIIQSRVRQPLRGRQSSSVQGAILGNVAKTDMTWVQFYPVLHEKGTGAKAK
jgi:hypothetical protein